jgi:DNA-binding PadR family transcriptional regulator
MMTVRNAILGLLARSPCYGYELRAGFEDLAGGEELWDVKPAQVYTTLARLEEGGFVQQEDGAGQDGTDRRVYAITPLGREELLAWLTSGVETPYQRDEFYIKLMISLVSGAVDPYQVIHQQRSRLFKEMHDLTLRRGRLDAHTDLAQLFLLDKVIMHIEADLRWLDMIESRLDEVRLHPPGEPDLKPRGRPKNK